MVQANRRLVIKSAAAAVGAMSFAPQLMAQSAPVRIGYSMSRTGPWTGGAQVSQEPNYLLWAEQQNAAGGLDVKGVKRQIELISSDDRSDTETVVRTYEKLMGSDKVDLVLPPWGSNANFAVAPLANRFQYPFLAPTALSRRLVEMKLPYFFLLLQQPAPMTNALVDMLKANGVKTVALIYVDDLFGLENFAAFKVALQGSGITLVEDKSYPGGVKDLSPVLRSMKDKNPDAFVGFTYPPDTILASVMFVNNEIGVIQDIAALGTICREKGIIFHVDAAQATGRVDIDLATLPVDLMSLTSHKTYGPKGIGALFVRRKPRVRIEAQMHGGGHERGMRSGTLPTHQIVGMGEAYRIAKAEMHEENQRIRALHDRMVAGLKDIEEVFINGHETQRVPHNLNMSFNYVEGESLIMGIKGLAVSSGSACTSASLEPSYVLRALGRSDELAHSSLRMTIGRWTTEEEIDYAISTIKHNVAKLRELSPLWEMYQDGVDISSIQWTAH